MKDRKMDFEKFVWVSPWPGPLKAYRRGMLERDAKSLAKSMNKKDRRHQYEAVRVGHSWDVVRRRH